MNKLPAPRLIWLAEAQRSAYMVTRFLEPTIHFVWHYHPETAELVWVRRGKGMRRIASSIESFSDGDLCLMGADVPHTYGSTSDHKGLVDWTVLGFCPNLWGEAFWKLPELRNIAELLKMAKFGIHFDGPKKWRVGNLLEQLAAQRFHSEGSLLLVVEILRELAMDCQRRPLHAQQAPLPGAVAAARLREVMTHIEANFAEAITEADVARRVRMNSAAFSQWFKRNAGHTFQNHLNHVRVARVCLQLAANNDPVTQIALACGFNNLANFNRRFREIVGCTPREYRDNLRYMEATAASGWVIRLGRGGAHRVPPTRSVLAG